MHNRPAIRRSDLRFSVAETREYLQRATEQPVTDAVAATLTEKTEGWITGLHLAVLKLRQVSDSSEFVASFESSEGYIMDYLVDEVLSLQSAAVQEFLLKTSVLDRLYGPLCEAVTGLASPINDGQSYLERLEQGNLFVIALDSQRQWYRYHHLFQLLLQNRLERTYDREQIAGLHRRASAWFADNGFVEDAITHALAAGDEATAVRVIVTHRYEAMNRERWQQIDRWLRMLPPQRVDDEPALRLLRAWILQRQWRFADLPAYLDGIDTQIDALEPSNDTHELRGEVDALRSMLSYFALHDGEEVSALAHRALERLPMANSSARGLAWLYYAAGFQALGDTKRARQIHLEGEPIFDKASRDRFVDTGLDLRITLAGIVAGIEALKRSRVDRRIVRIIRRKRSIAQAVFGVGITQRSTRREDRPPGEAGILAHEERTLVSGEQQGAVADETGRDRETRP